MSIYLIIVKFIEFFSRIKKVHLGKKLITIYHHGTKEQLKTYFQIKFNINKI